MIPSEIILADFPWPYTSFGTAKLSYETMTEQEIGDFDFGRFAAKKFVLFAWVTGPKMNLAFRCIERWCAEQDMRFIGVPYVWVKTTQAGKPIGASGPRPTLVKPLGEFVVALTNVKRGRPFPLLTESQTQWCFEEDTFQNEAHEILAPKAGIHSRKPAVVREKIVELFGDRPRIELFARERVEGWQGFGLEYPDL